MIDGKLWLERALANELDVGMWNSDGGAVISARGTYPRRLIPPYHLAECCPMAALPWAPMARLGGRGGHRTAG